MPTKKLSVVLVSFVVGLALVAISSPEAMALCYNLRTPQPGYIPGVEDSPCTACVANGCVSYLHCPPGTKCELTFIGKKPCTPATAVVPLDVYIGGSCMAGGGNCCNAGTLLGPSATTTCSVPADTLGNTSCFFIKDGNY